MTIEEAAATLGLPPGRFPADDVERNYRLKVKHCHPDRADYPGASAEFKRSTEALNRLREHAAQPSSSHPALEEAVDKFLFAVAVTRMEVWLSLSWKEMGARILGDLKASGAESGFVAKDQPLMQLISKSGKTPPRTLAVAPVDAEVFSVEWRDGALVWLLRPTEKHEVRRRFERSLASGLSLTDADTLLDDELYDAARAPMSDRNSIQEGKP